MDFTSSVLRWSMVAPCRSSSRQSAACPPRAAWSSGVVRMSARGNAASQLAKLESMARWSRTTARLPLEAAMTISSAALLRRPLWYSACFRRFMAFSRCLSSLRRPSPLRRM